MRATRTPEASRTSATKPAADSPSPGKTTLVERASGSVVQRKASGAAAAGAAGGADAHAVAAHGVDGATSDFPHRPTIEDLFGQPIGARAALGGGAAAACDELGARAYTRGDRVAFASTSPDLHLAAHEAAHTVQQRQGIQLSGGFGHAGDAHERMADEAADRVTRGESAADLFGGRGATSAAPAGVQMQQRPEGSGGQGWQAVVAAIRRADPVAGSHDYQGALHALETLSMADMLRALQEVANLGELENFFREAGAHGSDRARAAFRAVYIERNVSSVDRSVLDDLNQILSSLPPADQVTVVAHVAQATGRGGNELLAEGAAAAVQAASTPMAAATAAAPNPVGPGPWNPPGNQPIPFYIGNEAHVAIALAYVAAHAGQQVFTNAIPFSSIFGQVPGARPSAVDAANLALKPDIANITLRHLYEIKPVAQVAEAQTKLSLYLGIFATAGVPMTAGSQTEPGTAGVLQAPGGYYMYECPMPGVILYQYRRGPYQPEPVPVPERQTEPQRQTDPDFWRRMELATGLTGAALVIYLIISEGSRVVFPPRNLVPVP